MSREVVEIWKGPLAIWVALLLLLLLTTGSAYLNLGAANMLINMAVSATKAALILVFFMNLISSSALVRLAAGAGLFWLSFMFALTMSDYLTR